MMRLWLLVQTATYTIGVSAFRQPCFIGAPTDTRDGTTRNNDRGIKSLAPSRCAFRNVKRRRRRSPTKGPPLVRSVSSTADAIESNSSSPPPAMPIVDHLDQFVTPPLQVYIEDTDAYGVMYNGNYLRAYDRALHMMLVPSPSSSSSAAVGDLDDWSIVSVKELKFKSPPPLGGTYCIEGTRRRRPQSSSSPDASFATDDGGNGISKQSMLPVNSANYSDEEVWDMTMRSPDGSIVYNTATGVTLARASSLHKEPAFSLATANVENQIDWLPSPPPLFYDGSSSTATATSSIDSFRTYRDEFEPHLESHVPLRIALNYMERSRTNCIGGPSMLHELQNTHGVLYVVTAVRNCSLVSYMADSSIGGGANLGRRTQPRRLVPGMQVDVETSFRARKRGAIIDCYHTLVLKGETKPIERHRMAQGVVTIMALDATTRRPTNKLPSWLRSRFDGSYPTT
jgi:hypothetical protein